MGNLTFQSALDEAHAEMLVSLQEREKIDARIASLKKTIEGLEMLCGEEPDDNNELKRLVPLSSLDGVAAGITTAIREVLWESRVPLHAPQIRDLLVSRGVDLSGYANELSVIHNTLRRLASQDEVVALPEGIVFTDKGMQKMRDRKLFLGESLRPFPEGHPLHEISKRKK